MILRDDYTSGREITLHTSVICVWVARTFGDRGLL